MVTGRIEGKSVTLGAHRPGRARHWPGSAPARGTITFESGGVVTGTVVGVHRDYVALLADAECAGAIRWRSATEDGLSPVECHARRLLQAVDVAANVLADADLANREDPVARPGTLHPDVARELAHALYALVEILPRALVPLEVGAPIPVRAASSAAAQAAAQMYLLVRQIVVRLEI